MKPNKQHNAIRLSEVLGVNTGKITSIVGQKKNKNRFSLFVDEQFVVGISDSCLVSLNLKKGDELDQTLLDKIQDYEEQWATRNFFLRLLSRRDHTPHELKQKALKKGLNSSVIEQILNDLNQKGYINNAEFAKKYARDKFEFNKWGPKKIQIELLKKGINKTDISKALLEISSDAQSKKMNALFEKSKPKFIRTESAKRRKKIFDFFLRKGYPPELILSVIDNYITQLKS